MQTNAKSYILVVQTSLQIIIEWSEVRNG